MINALADGVKDIDGRLMGDFKPSIICCRRVVMSSSGLGVIRVSERARNAALIPANSPALGRLSVPAELSDKYKRWPTKTSRPSRPSFSLRTLYDQKGAVRYCA